VASHTRRWLMEPARMGRESRSPHWRCTTGGPPGPQRWFASTRRCDRARRLDEPQGRAA